MKPTRILSLFLALLLLLGSTLSLFGCSSKATPEQVQESASDFSVRLFQSPVNIIVINLYLSLITYQSYGFLLNPPSHFV